MASSFTLLLISILLAAATYFPSALALAVDGQTISDVAFGGAVYCSTDGNPRLPGPTDLLPGVRVDLRCGNPNGDNQLVRSTMTDPSGRYLFVFNLVEGPAFDPNQCYVVVEMPLGHCVFSRGGGFRRLEAPISVLGVFETLVGNLLMGLVGPFTPVAQ